MYNYAISKIDTKYFTKNKIYSLEDYAKNSYLLTTDQYNKWVIYPDDSDFFFLLNFEEPLIDTIDELINMNIAIHCPTEQDGRDFIEYCFNNQIKWSQEPCTIEQRRFGTDWNRFKGETCYYIYEDIEGIPHITNMNIYSVIQSRKGILDVSILKDESDMLCFIKKGDK